MRFLRTALNASARSAASGASAPIHQRCARSRTARIDKDMLRRGVNVGFSGGEKKRNEILQMALLEPRLCVLDETDSGLDIDALKVVSEGVNRLRSPTAPSWSSRTTSACSITSCRTWCTFFRRAAS
jgi:Fe-S cluster assembly ATP-binding protein